MAIFRDGLFPSRTKGVKEHWDMPIYADHWHFPQFHKTVGFPI